MLTVEKTSPPTVWANNAGEFIRRYSPIVVCNGSSGEFIRRYSPIVVCNGSSATVWDQTSPPTVWTKRRRPLYGRIMPANSFAAIRPV
jgi:hypothetical protein